MQGDADDHNTSPARPARPAGPATPRQAGIKDVARVAAVSVGTVSHVLNHPERVTPALIDRVHAAMEELRFVRNGVASQLRAGKRHAIGLVVPDISNPFFAAVARGAEDEADERGYSMLIVDSAESSPRERRHVQFLIEERVSGVLLSPVDDRETESAITALTAGAMPFVLVDHITTEAGCCSVAVDDIRGGELAGLHMLSRGARRIAYVGGPAWIRQCADRLSGLRAAVEADPSAAKIVAFTIDALTWRAGYDAVGEVLHATPDAIFCANDVVALGVLRGLIEHNLRVPRDVALVGYDDIDFASSAAVPLTSVRQPAYQIGRTSASLLFNEQSASDVHAHQQVLFRPELVARASTVEPSRRAPKRRDAS